MDLSRDVLSICIILAVSIITKFECIVLRVVVKIPGPRLREVGGPVPDVIEANRLINIIVDICLVKDVVVLNHQLFEGFGLVEGHHPTKK